MGKRVCHGNCGPNPQKAGVFGMSVTIIEFCLSACIHCSLPYSTSCQYVQLKKLRTDREEKETTMSCEGRETAT